MISPAKKHDDPLMILKELRVFRTSDAVDAGVSQPTLSRLAAAGKIIRLEHGLFQHPKARVNPRDLDLAVACTRLGPKSVIGGLTALYRHGLIAQVPDQIWVMVPYPVKTKAATYHCIRTQHDATIGIEDHGIYRIATVERAVIEALRYASKVGTSLAVNAARTALEKGKTSEKKLYDIAKSMELSRVLEKYWEVITPS